MLSALLLLIYLFISTHCTVFNLTHYHIHNNKDAVINGVYALCSEENITDQELLVAINEYLPYKRIHHYKNKGHTVYLHLILNKNERHVHWIIQRGVTKFKKSKYMGFVPGVLPVGKAMWTTTSSIYELPPADLPWQNRWNDPYIKVSVKPYPSPLAPSMLFPSQLIASSYQHTTHNKSDHYINQSVFEDESQTPEKHKNYSMSSPIFITPHSTQSIPNVTTEDMQLSRFPSDPDDVVSISGNIHASLSFTPLSEAGDVTQFHSPLGDVRSFRALITTNGTLTLHGSDISGSIKCSYEEAVDGHGIAIISNAMNETEVIETENVYKTNQIPMENNDKLDLHISDQTLMENSGNIRYDKYQKEHIVDINNYNYKIGIVLLVGLCVILICFVACVYISKKKNVDKEVYQMKHMHATVKRKPVLNKRLTQEKCAMHIQNSVNGSVNLAVSEGEETIVNKFKPEKFRDALMNLNIADDIVMGDIVKEMETEEGIKWENFENEIDIDLCADEVADGDGHCTITMNDSD